MKCFPFPCSDALSGIARDLQASAIGIAKASVVPSAIIDKYNEWIERGCQGGMSYMERYRDVRANPDLLLSGVKSIIVAAFNYYYPSVCDKDTPRFALYALGDDYHEVIRQRLELLASFIKEQWGGATRVCVDTAPIFERYWAQQSGIGFVGRNKMLIVPGVGSYVFVGIVLSTVSFIPDAPCELDCMGCNACVRHCPGKAISLNGIVDARRCHSYLTIEHRGELPNDIDLGNKVYGCDVCQQVCPHNHNAPTTAISEFFPRAEILSLSHSDITEMTQMQFSKIFSHSAIKRAKLAGLQRNNRHCSNDITTE